MRLVLIRTRKRVVAVRIVSVPHHGDILLKFPLINLDKVVAEPPRHLNRRLRLDAGAALLVLLTLRLGERDSDLES